MNVLLVMIGGFLGAILRFALGEWVYTINGFPLDTLIINLMGCFFLGWFLTYVIQKEKISPEYTLIVGTGLIGSFTTFSTFSLETINLFQQGLIFLGATNVLGTTVLSLLLVYLGRRLALSKKKAGVVE